MRKGSPGTGAPIGAGIGLLSGVLVGAVIDLFRQLGEEVLTLGTADTKSSSSFVIASGLTLGVVGGAIGLAVGSDSWKTYFIEYNREDFSIEKENLQEHSLQWIMDNDK
jgi:hypothetical protein